MAGYWPCNFFGSLWASSLPQSINKQEKNLANIHHLDLTLGQLPMHLAHLGSQSLHRIWFILLAHGTSRVIKWLHGYYAVAVTSVSYVTLHSNSSQSLLPSLSGFTSYTNGENYKRLQYLRIEHNRLIYPTSEIGTWVWVVFDNAHVKFCNHSGARIID